MIKIQITFLHFKVECDFHGKNDVYMGYDVLNCESMIKIGDQLEK